MKGKLFNPQQVKDGIHIEYASKQQHAYVKTYPNGFVKVVTTKYKTEEEKQHDRRRKAQYMRRCKELTETNAQEMNITQRGFSTGNHIDHIVPREYGFKNNIPVELIASKENLQILTRQDNIDKGDKITTKAKELLQKWGF